MNPPESPNSSGHDNAVSHARVMRSLRAMTKNELVRTLVDAGILTEDGQLTEPYRDEQCPDCEGYGNYFWIVEDDGIVPYQIEVRICGGCAGSGQRGAA